MISQPEYNLNRPASSLKLPKELKEISGISFYGDDRLLAIQDEHGIVFLLSISDGEILESIPFGNDGDYEGIAYDSKNIYVLRSDGNIYTLYPEGQDSIRVKALDTHLDSSHDTEGICYDPKNKSLLIVCKENGSDDAVRNIYRYRPETDSLEPEPAFRISASDIREYLKLAPESPELDLLKEEFEDKAEDFSVFPSDIAVHPVSGDIYICSAKGVNLLIVLSAEGGLKSLQLIPDDLLEQPEGISFTPQGDLIICSEGKPKKERLFIFSWDKN